MELLQSPVFRGVLTGVIAAAAVDFQAFRSWRSFDEAARYAWGLAIWRWVLGGVVGLLTSLAGLPAGAL